MNHTTSEPNASGEQRQAHHSSDRSGVCPAVPEMRGSCIFLLADDGNLFQVKHSCMCWGGGSLDVVSSIPTGEPCLEKTGWEVVGLGLGLGNIHLMKIMILVRNGLLIMSIPDHADTADLR